MVKISSPQVYICELLKNYVSQIIIKLFLDEIVHLLLNNPLHLTRLHYNHLGMTQIVDNYTYGSTVIIAIVAILS